MIDGKEGELEIKLGANAAAILMLTKYQEITGKDDYLKYAEKLAHGILELVDPDGLTGEFKHEVRQFEKSYDNQQAEQISLMV
ncbi:hypothetical protein APC31_15530 [Acinetobacter baumannii]|nr:hypothetical protein APC31_15530 [Acinetobacter baumannii]